MTAIWIVLAGGTGAGLRYLVESRFPTPPGGLPWALLAINASGSGALGTLLGSGAGADAAAVVGTGLLGGFTSLSAASLDVAGSDGLRRAATSAGLMLVVAVAAASVGWSVSA